MTERWISGHLFRNRWGKQGFFQNRFGDTNALPGSLILKKSSKPLHKSPNCGKMEKIRL
jgi:hypothetical protein